MIREDKKRAYAISFSICALLLLAIFIPTSVATDEIIFAVALLPCFALVLYFIKRRKVLSYNKGQVLMLMCASALMFFMLYYLSGLFFGYGSLSSRLNVAYYLTSVLPAVVIIVLVEIIRAILVMQDSKVVYVCAYVIGVFSELIVLSNIPTTLTFYTFMDAFALNLIPAFVFSYLHSYVAKLYGAKPNIAFRLLLTIPTIALWRLPVINDALYAFARIVIPYAIYSFIKALYENKNKFALKRSSKWSNFGFITALSVMVCIIMLVSCQFRFGAIVIGTGSMTGEMNVGDVVVYERYEGEDIKNGDVLVFYKYETLTVHRVVDIKYIDGIKRYYTKGDANEELDSGYVTDSSIVGVVKGKVPYVGYATIGLRDLFNK